MSTKSKSDSRRRKVLKKAKAKKRVRYYGMVKVPKGAKICWLSVQNKNGWSLGLALGKRTIWLRNVRISSKEEVSRVTDAQKVVFVGKKGK